MIHGYLALYLHEFQMRVVCIRALGAIGRLPAETTLMGLSDDDWRIRAVSAKAACVASDPILFLLKGLLYDPVYMVRINAARKLADLGEKGVSILENEMKSEDRYVRDTVRFILEKAGAHV
jgi:HEAT repeat protein